VNIDPLNNILEMRRYLVMEQSKMPAEIQSMLSPHGEPNIDRQLLAAKADQIDAQVRQLRAMSRGLRHAAACKAPTMRSARRSVKLLKAAAQGP
jgi:hypothetical protein